MEVLTFLIFICLCSTVDLASSSGSCSSSSTYIKPKCQDEEGFYCSQTETCLPRTDRCTRDDGPLCTQKTYEHCNYDSEKGRFRVVRHSTSLFSFSSSSRGISDCLSLIYKYKKEHQFITYRGLMYEFGCYGVRIQDPSDPNYEHNIPKTKKDKTLGTSNCTYEDVLRFTKTWDDYDLCSHNCQDFAKGLRNWLLNDCPKSDYRQRKQVPRSNDDSDDLAYYIFSIAGNGSCTNVTLSKFNYNSGSASLSASSFVFSASIIIGSFVVFHGR